MEESRTSTSYCTCCDSYQPQMVTSLLSDPAIVSSAKPGKGSGDAKRSKRTSTSEEYNMSHKHRGQAVIFNHNRFGYALAPRFGSQQDVRAVSESLKRIGFEVTVYEDLKQKDLLKKLLEVSHMDHSDADCLLIVVMSHGNKGELSAYDKPYNISVLWNSFKGEESPTLVSKPKIFFIQACRGSAVDNGVFCNCDTHFGSSTDSTYIVPSYADFFIANATFDGYAAFRSPTSGSWFIQTLCKELEECGGTKEICDIFTRVNRRVALTCQSNNPMEPRIHLKKQMPNFFSTLTKRLYFRPKKSKK